MYYFLSIFAGVVISIMISLNGSLTQSYGTYLAAVIIHIVGVCFALFLCILKKELPNIKKKAPLWAYLGGAIGVLSTIFNNYAFGRISVTSIVALGLLGQSLASILLDSFGLLGIKKQRMNSLSIIGYLTAIIGIFIMFDFSTITSVVPFILSLSAGVTVSLSRVVNARLSKETGPLIGSLINHFVGLPLCILLLLFLQRPILFFVKDTNIWIYLGGMFGVFTVLLFNITVPKVSAFRLTLLSFLGQIFTSIVIDFALGLEYSNATFFGGIIIAVGLLLNMGLEQFKKKS